MPELPEVQTTVTGLNRAISGQTIISVWTDYNSPYFKGSETIKDPAYFKLFSKNILGRKIISVTRRAKNIIIHLENMSGSKVRSDAAILIHMKMTGHIIVGDYIHDDKKNVWSPSPNERKALHDPYNRFIHFVISLSNGRKLVLCDTRKFAKVTYLDNKNNSAHLKDLGPEPLDPDFTFELFKKCIQVKPSGKIKTVLMDQSIISGIGNIYSDESLWRAHIHPEEIVSNINDNSLKLLFFEIKKVLKSGIDFGGDSMSDYRNIDGEKGKFQEHHQVYRKKGSSCSMISLDKHGKKKIKCEGIIRRIVVGGRSTHFCPIHQKLNIEKSI